MALALAGFDGDRPVRARRAVTTLLLGIVVTLALPSSPAAGVAHRIRVIDGDTLDANVVVWPNVVVISRIRLNRIDAPEIHRAPPCEESAGEEAKKYLEALLAGADGKLTVDPVTIDSFGRVVAELTLGGINVNDNLLATKHAMLWTGKRVPWPCEALPL